MTSIIPFLLTGTVIFELFEGRPLLPPEGFKLWYGSTEGPHTSQYLFDPWSFTHIEHGLLLYWLIVGVYGFSGDFIPALTVAVFFECLWEMIENSNWGIKRYRKTDQGYFGDSVLNSLGDIFSAFLGFWLAWNYIPTPFYSLLTCLLYDGIFYLIWGFSMFQSLFGFITTK